MRFAKYHGTGNDFIMVEDLDGELSLGPAIIAALCDRHRGIGADGLIRIVRGTSEDGADFFMDYSNANGEVAEMCGNGIRCLAKYVRDRALTESNEIDVITRAGLKHLVLETEDDQVRRVTVDMGSPALERKAIPMDGEPTETFLGQPLVAGGRQFIASAISMGNTHCVLFLGVGDDLDSFDVRGVGSEVERRPEFPNRTNVEFVTVLDGRIHLRVWERGSGETMACGTGACAALVACALSGRTGRQAEVEFPGGLLKVEWRDDDHVFLTGPAVFVFEGEVSDAWLSQLSEGVSP
jgi:diaminopimelate epimerase